MTETNGVKLSAELRQLLEKADQAYREWSNSQEDFFGEDQMKTAAGLMVYALRRFYFGAIAQNANPADIEQRLRHRYSAASGHAFFEGIFDDSKQEPADEESLLDPAYLQRKIQYDPEVIRGYAANLYKTANLLVIVSVLAGGMLGGLALSPLGAALGLVAAGTLSGILIGGGLGFFFGDLRASAMRLEAQQALCQVQIEENTRQLLLRAPEFFKIDEKHIH